MSLSLTRQVSTSEQGLTLMDVSETCLSSLRLGITSRVVTWRMLLSSTATDPTPIYGVIRQPGDDISRRVKSVSSAAIAPSHTSNQRAAYYRDIRLSVHVSRRINVMTVGVHTEHDEGGCSSPRRSQSDQPHEKKHSKWQHSIETSRSIS